MEPRKYERVEDIDKSADLKNLELLEQYIKCINADKKIKPNAQMRLQVGAVLMELDEKYIAKNDIVELIKKALACVLDSDKQYENKKNMIILVDKFKKLFQDNYEAELLKKFDRNSLVVSPEYDLTNLQPSVSITCPYNPTIVPILHKHFSDELKKTFKLNGEVINIKYSPDEKSTGVHRANNGLEIAVTQSIEASDEFAKQMKWEKESGMASFFTKGIGRWLPEQAHSIYFNQKFFILESLNKFIMLSSDVEEIKQAKQLYSDMKACDEKKSTFFQILNEPRPIIETLKNNESFYQAYFKSRFLKSYAGIESLIKTLSNSSSMFGGLAEDGMRKGIVRTLIGYMNLASTRVGGIAALESNISTLWEINAWLFVNDAKSKDTITATKVVNEILNICKEPFNQSYSLTKSMTLTPSKIGGF